MSIFGAYFPFATRYSLDVPALFDHWGLNEIWREAYKEIPGVEWICAGSWDPCNFSTTTPIKSLADLKGKRVFSFPTGGKFMSRFGVIPTTLPWEDIQVALQTKELDGVCWSGITEMYTSGWAENCHYFLTNNICGAWIGSYFVNSKKWKELPDHLKALFKLSSTASTGTGGVKRTTASPAARWSSPPFRTANGPRSRMRPTSSGLKWPSGAPAAPRSWTFSQSTMTRWSRPAVLTVISSALRPVV